MNWGIDYQIFTKLFLLGILLAASAAAIHAIIYKRNARSTVTWLGFILIWPLLGAIFYYYFGINRISRKALKRKAIPRKSTTCIQTQKQIAALTNESYTYQSILECSKRLGCPEPALSDVYIHTSGGSAYQAMLEAINEASFSIALYSYIFENDDTGQQFISSLISAKHRGLEICFMLDAVGSSKWQHKVIKQLTKAGIKAVRFLPVLWRSNLSNLRNHRKLLIIDGNRAFTGGLNISSRYWEDKAKGDTVLDFTCEYKGALVSQLQEIFVDDWYFATSEILGGDAWFPEEETTLRHSAVATLIAAGPVYQQERIHWHFLNAINAAKHRLCIATPYFMPDEAMIFALCSAALRGVKVELLIPENIDHKVMNWGLNAVLPELLLKGCRVYRSRPLFDHSKLLIVDDAYVSLGSANWDARSFRLNFELNVGLLNKDLTAELIAFFESKLVMARVMDFDELKHRTLWKKVRDGLAQMLTPYL